MTIIESMNEVIFTIVLSDLISNFSRLLFSSPKSKKPDTKL